MAEFLFEIGFEEMPAPWLPRLGNHLKNAFSIQASAQGLAPIGVSASWTSRRLVLVAVVAERQEDRTVLEWGPPAKLARDDSGAWTKAALGFARKQGVGPDRLSIAPKVAGRSDLYLMVSSRQIGRPAGDVLAGLLPGLLRGFGFPKQMNWDAWLDDGRGAFEFGRPIQWLVALLDGEIVPFTIFDAVEGAKGPARVVSGRRSMGNRFYPRGAADRGFDVHSYKDLKAGLADRFVMLDRDERVRTIRTFLDSLPELYQMRSGPEAVKELVEAEWPDLVEWPSPIVGHIPPDLQDLPIDVMATVLLAHQKALALGPPGVGTVSAFVAISGCDPVAAPNAARGQERVVVARLKDARFFYDEDRKRTIESRVKDLAAVTFHKSLGSYKDKAERISMMATDLAGRVGLSALTTTAAGRAALFAKADLVTLMVREFPELQGVMGGLYAAGTESPDVASAIRWHYHPVAIEPGAAPKGRIQGTGQEVFSVVALVDKMDTLIGYFGLGQIPSGSSDPFGLRRAGQGVIRVLLDFWTAAAPRLDDVIADGHRLYGSRLSKSTPEVQASLRAFLIERLRAVFLAREAGSSDEVEAVLHARIDPLADVRATATRLRDLVAVRSEQREVFADLAEAFKRARNIVGETAAGEVDTGVFEDDAERTLYEVILKAEAVPPSFAAARFQQIAWTHAAVDEFFKRVMVMADDPAVRANRLALLSRLLNLVYEVADLSRLAAPAGASAATS